MEGESPVREKDLLLSTGGRLEVDSWRVSESSMRCFAYDAIGRGVFGFSGTQDTQSAYKLTQVSA